MRQAIVIKLNEYNLNPTSNKLSILDIGGTRFHVRNNGTNLSIDGISLQFNVKGELMVFRDSTNLIYLNSFDKLKRIVNKYRIMYKKALVFSKQLQIEEDFYE